VVEYLPIAINATERMNNTITDANAYMICIIAIKTDGNIAKLRRLPTFSTLFKALIDSSLAVYISSDIFNLKALYAAVEINN
jgi:hypothetical protein